MSNIDIPWQRLATQPKWVGALVTDLSDKLDRVTQQLNASRKAEEVKPDVPPPSVEEPYPRRLSKGWAYWLCNGVVSVNRACSSSIGHNNRSDEATNSQGNRWLYSSRLLALKSARHELESQYLTAAANLQRQIDQAGEAE